MEADRPAPLHHNRQSRTVWSHLSRRCRRPPQRRGCASPAGAASLPETRAPAGRQGRARGAARTRPGALAACLTLWAAVRSRTRIRGVPIILCAARTRPARTRARDAAAPPRWLRGRQVMLRGGREAGTVTPASILRMLFVLRALEVRIWGESDHLFLSKVSAEDSNDGCRE